MPAQDDTIQEVMKLLRPWKSGVSEAKLSAEIASTIVVLRGIANDENLQVTAAQTKNAANNLAKKTKELLAALHTFSPFHDIFVFGPLAPANRRRGIKLSRKEFTEAVRAVRAGAEDLGTVKVPKAAPRIDPVQSNCADAAYRLMQSYSTKRIYASDRGSFRRITGVLYEHVTGIQSEDGDRIDPERACEDFLRRLESPS